LSIFSECGRRLTQIPATTASSSDRGGVPEVSFSQPEPGIVAVHLGGDWAAHGRLPPPAAVEAALAQSPDARCVRFAVDALTGWDSRLVAFVLAVGRICDARQVRLDAAGLPDGAERLMRLATAVAEKSGARRTAAAKPFLERVGERWQRAVKAVQDAVRFLGEVSLGIGRLFTGRTRLRRADLWQLMEECGAGAAAIVCLTSVLTGMSIAFVGAIQLQQFGAEIFVADLVALSAVREMAASMTAFVMAGRTGAAFAARLGTMQVNEEVDALQTFGVPPIDFLVIPRIVALVLMMPLLYFYACVMAIIGGALVVVGTQNVSAFAYLHQTIGALDLLDFAVGVAKAVVFGALIAFFGCYRGIRCGRSAAAVGEAATSAVVQSIVAIIVANMVFAVITNILGV
jgi:phospholipid/cholesterol/gamma-HCH transport system permease protein